MGTFSVTVDIGDPAARRFESVEALVDTGASYTMLSASLLSSLNVTPHTRREFELATGEAVTRDIGRTWLRIDGHMEMTIVVFGDENAEPLLGAVTLEEFGLGVDPLRRRLIPVRGWLT